MCHRLATATGAGLEDRRIWRSEAERGGRAQQRKLAPVADRLAGGGTLPEALKASGDYLPPLFHQMATVGEMSGQLDRTYQQLAKHYDGANKARREFLGRLAWPMFQLGMAVIVVGILIWVAGLLPINRGAGGTQVDLLGFGLVGNRGLLLYINFLILAGIVVLLLIEASRRGMLWAKWLERASLAIPVVGGALQTLALARFTWAAQLVFDTPMDLRRALPLALDATGNDYYARHGPAVAARIEQGVDVATALSETGVFPGQLIDSVAVGETSGMLAETMRREAHEYQQRGAAAMSLLAQIFGYLIWLLVAGLIIMLIFRLATFYVDTLQSFT